MEDSQLYAAEPKQENWLSRHRWFIPVLAAFFLTSLDPFGFSSLTKNRSAEVLNQVVAPFYAPDGHPYISIVLVEDDYIREKDDFYPMSRYNFLELTDQISSGNPAAIFFDFHLGGTKGDADDTALLGELIAEYAANPRSGDGEETWEKPRIWFGDLGGNTAQQNVFSLAEQVRTLPVKITGITPGHYPLCLTETGEIADCSEPKSRRSPALELYQVYCDRYVIDGCQTITGRSAMIPQWNRKLVDGQSDCPGQLRTFSDKLSASLHLFLRGMASGDGVSALCYPFQTISAIDLIGIRGDDTRGAMSTEALKRAFSGNIVLVGGYFEYAPDQTISPVHGQVPGVYAHATALENLINYGDDYWREGATTNLLGIKFKLSSLLEYLTLIAASVILYRATSTYLTQKQLIDDDRVGPEETLSANRAQMVSTGCYSLAMCITVITLSVALPVWNSLPPTNFYGLLTLTLPLVLALFGSSLLKLIQNEYKFGLLAPVSRPIRLLATFMGPRLIVGLACAFFLIGGLIYAAGS